MSDINLLPIEQRKRENDESKKKTLAKSRIDIELTRPDIEKKQKSISSFSKTKAWFKGLFKKKLAKEKFEPTSLIIQDQ